MATNHGWFGVSSPGYGYHGDLSQWSQLWAQALQSTHKRRRVLQLLGSATWARRARAGRAGGWRITEMVIFSSLLGSRLAPQKSMVGYIWRVLENVHQGYQGYQWLVLKHSIKLLPQYHSIQITQIVELASYKYFNLSWATRWHATPLAMFQLPCEAPSASPAATIKSCIGWVVQSWIHQVRKGSLKAMSITCHGQPLA